MTFDWHSDDITRETPLGPDYRTTQNVRRFLTRETGLKASLNRDFMAWIRSGAPKTMGDVVDEFRKRFG
ncbi:MAG: DUF6434 domain-containing protein [Pseudomonadota bacterium]